MARRRTDRSSRATGHAGTSARRTPVPIRAPRRTPGDLVKAFLASVALVALVIGVPAGLVLAVGRPLPDGSPGPEWLKRPVTTETFLTTLTVLVWPAWAQVTAGVLVEVRAALCGAGVPGRVPGAGPAQLLARQLVAALLPVGATTARLAPQLAPFGAGAPHLPDGRPTAVAAEPAPVPALLGGTAESTAGAAAAVAEQAAHAAGRAEQDTVAARRPGPTKVYRIQPPEGRPHDSLWEIAARHLGDGRRCKATLALNKDRVQPDGSRLTGAGPIRPGWVMEVPADARGGDLVGMPDPDAVPRVADPVARSGARGVPPRIEALVDELLPAWRESAAAVG